MRNGEQCRQVSVFLYFVKSTIVNGKLKQEGAVAVSIELGKPRHHDVLYYMGFS